MLPAPSLMWQWTGAKAVPTQSWGEDLVSRGLLRNICLLQVSPAAQCRSELAILLANIHIDLGRPVKGLDFSVLCCWNCSLSGPGFISTPFHPLCSTPFHPQPVLASPPCFPSTSAWTLLDGGSPECAATWSQSFIASGGGFAFACCLCGIQKAPSATRKFILSVLCALRMGTTTQYLILGHCCDWGESTGGD